MLISLQQVLEKYNLKPTGVIHVGAHWAEEHDDYIKCGVERFVYIEPGQDSFEIMVRKLFNNNKYGLPYPTKNHDIKNGLSLMNESASLLLFQLACGSSDELMPMYISHQNQGQSNSLLEPNLHLQQHPEIIFDDAEIVKVIPLDKLPIEKNKYNMLVMDVQGYEGEVLKGATETLKHIDIIYTEVNRGQTYSGNMEIDEMDKFLQWHGFVRKETYWPSPNWTWGDAIYIKVNKKMDE